MKFAEKKEKKTSGEKSLSELLNDIDLTDESLYTIEDGVVDDWISGLQTSSSARSPQEIDEMNNKKFEAGVKAAQFCAVASEKAILSADEVKDSDRITDGVKKETVKTAIKASILFAFVHGNVTSRKLWIKIPGEEKDDKPKFVSFPLLNSVGSRSVLVHVYRDEIANLLSKGKDNTLTTVLKKSNVEIKAEKRKYLFPKGHLLATSKEEINAIREDLNIIFQQMTKPIEKRKFELKWFNK